MTLEQWEGEGFGPPPNPLQPAGPARLPKPRPPTFQPRGHLGKTPHCGREPPPGTTDGSPPTRAAGAADPSKHLERPKRGGE